MGVYALLYSGYIQVIANGAGRPLNRQIKRMKNLLLTSIFFTTILSCTNKTNSLNSSNQNVTKDSSITQTERDEIKINVTLPFGCAELTEFKYPKHWNGDLENYGQLKQPKGQEFDNIGQYFSAINKVETIKLKPKILEVNHIKIGKDFLNTVYYDTISQQRIESLKYRLPNIGNYQCYYFLEQSQKLYGNYGNLLLLDPKSKKGKTLNVYYEVGGDQHVNFRYFYLDGETIRIYEGSCYDDGCDLTERFSVNIKTDGQIIINELK